MTPAETLHIVQDAARWVEPGRDGVAPIVEAIGDARLILIGEASHGTDEFYRLRADITAGLIEQKGFTVVAAEADWTRRTRCTARALVASRIRRSQNVSHRYLT